MLIICKTPISRGLYQTSQTQGFQGKNLPAYLDLREGHTQTLEKGILRPYRRAYSDLGLPAEMGKSFLKNYAFFSFCSQKNMLKFCVNLFREKNTKNAKISRKQINAKFRGKTAYFVLFLRKFASFSLPFAKFIFAKKC